MSTTEIVTLTTADVSTIDAGTIVPAAPGRDRVKFWVFDESRLEAALAAWCGRARPPEITPRLVSDFLHSIEAHPLRGDIPPAPKVYEDGAA